MRTAGLILLWTGCILGAWIAARSREEVDWELFVPAALIAGSGIVLARRGSRRAGEQVAADVETLAASIERIAARIADLDEAKGGLNPYDVHGRIDALFRDDLAAFVAARESLARAFGLAAFAAVMDDFSAGERYLNRVWSASVDGYAGEVSACLGRAREQFEAARARLEALRRASGAGGRARVPPRPGP